MSVLWSSWTTLVSWPKTDVSRPHPAQLFFFFSRLGLVLQWCSQSCQPKNRSYVSASSVMAGFKFNTHLTWEKTPCLFLVVTEMKSLNYHGWTSCPLTSQPPPHPAPVAPLQRGCITLWFSMAPFMEVSFMTLCSPTRGPDIDLHQRASHIPASPLLCCGRPSWPQRDDYMSGYPFLRACWYVPVDLWGYLGRV